VIRSAIENTAARKAKQAVWPVVFQSEQPLRVTGTIHGFHDIGQKKTPWRHQRSTQWEQWFSRFSFLLRDSFRMTFHNDHGKHHSHEER
jgi:hypothetical protein